MELFGQNCFVLTIYIWYSSSYYLAWAEKFLCGAHIPYKLSLCEEKCSIDSTHKCCIIENGDILLSYNVTIAGCNKVIFLFDKASKVGCAVTKSYP